MAAQVEYPIVYVRGYAGTQGEVEDTVATPYMGFNLGSTKIRQSWEGRVERYVFESPLIRLMKDHGYGDIYEDGAEMPMERIPPMKSVWIYRYYEQVSKVLGDGTRPEIEAYARGLDRYLEQRRDQLCGGDWQSADPEVQKARKRFKVYLVAHSMGGLIVRCYLQRIWAEELAERVKNGQAVDGAPPPVDKVFTYATPHGGIDFRLVGNVPGFLQVNNIENFNEDRMRKYLGGIPENKPVTSLDGKFNANRFFCLVGTNHRDYGAGAGLSKHLVGPMSDGLVQIKNASVDRAPRAFVHRSHSGHYGIVNSEEGYQNLRRFLFGNVRVDAYLQCLDIRLPEEVEQARLDKKEVKASYHIEVIARVRRARWDLHRRTVREGSAKFCDYKRLKDSVKRPIRLASTYLLMAAAQKPEKLGFSMDLAVMVPEYVVNKRLFFDHHFDGGYLYRQKINFELAREEGQPPRLLWGLDSASPNRAKKKVETRELRGSNYEFIIPVVQKTRPGIEANLILRASPWS